MQTEPLLILGFGGHARSVADIAVQAGFTHINFYDPSAQEGEHFAQFLAQNQFQLAQHKGYLFPAAGDNKAREKQILDLIHHHTRLATLISPKAYLGLCVEILAGSLIAHHAHIGPNSKIGMGCIINTGAIVEHDCTVGDLTHVSVNATVAGRCHVGQRVFIGAGATLIDGVSIANDVTIGAGAVVVSDIEVPGVYVGVPARGV